MSTKKTVIGLIFIFIAVCSLVLYNAFYGFDRTFNLLVSEKYNICFLISNDYTFEKTTDGFRYRGGENHGHFTIRNEKLTENMVIRDMNGFKGGEVKEKNFRNFEYQIYENDPELLLVDRFEYVKKAPFHIFPRRDDCEQLKKVNQNQVKVFDE